MNNISITIDYPNDLTFKVALYQVFMPDFNEYGILYTCCILYRTSKFTKDKLILNSVTIRKHSTDENNVAFAYRTVLKKVFITSKLSKYSRTKIWEQLNIYINTKWKRK